MRMLRNHSRGHMSSGGTRGLDGHWSDTSSGCGRDCWLNSRSGCGLSRGQRRRPFLHRRSDRLPPGGPLSKLLLELRNDLLETLGFTAVL